MNTGTVPQQTMAKQAAAAPETKREEGFLSMIVYINEIRIV
jgi:hypothetical protein